MILTLGNALLNTSAMNSDTRLGASRNLLGKASEASSHVINGFRQMLDIQTSFVGGNE